MRAMRSRQPSSRIIPLSLLAILAVWASACSVGRMETDAEKVDPAESVESWRETRQDGLRSENGWLTLVGLTWLEPGDNDFGSGPKNPIVLPVGSAPEVAGTFRLEDGRVSVHAREGIELKVSDRVVTDSELASDANGSADVVRVGRLSLIVIERGGRLGIRIKDPESPVRTGFTGLEYFPVDPAYRVSARFVPHDPPREIEIPTVLGTAEPMLAPGYVEFELAGRTQRLEPVVSQLDADEYFFIFKDGTSGEETYGAGRFLYADAPEKGVMTLDFNRAYNPPCVFTPFATCPLPPRQNWMDVRVEAGEKTYGKH